MNLIAQQSSAKYSRNPQNKFFSVSKGTNLNGKDEHKYTSRLDSSVDVQNSVARTNLNPQNGYGKVNKVLFLNRVLVFLSLVLVIIISFQIVILQSKDSNNVQAFPFGVQADYEKIIKLNKEVSNVVPLPLESIKMDQQTGDKRIIATYLFLQKYNSPMATFSIAKTFVEHADLNGFGDKYMILPAISGVESGFGRLIPYTNTSISYNGWGWGGPGNWYYFDSWENAVEVISAGLAKGYGATGMNPDAMVHAYCPPCAQDGRGIWQSQVNIYMNELLGIEQSI